MSITRRGFFGSLTAAIATATLDPDKLLWVPGQKVYSIPAVVKPKIAEVAQYAFTGHRAWTVEVGPLLSPEMQEWYDALTTEYFVAQPGEARSRVISQWSDKIMTEEIAKMTAL